MGRLPVTKKGNKNSWLTRDIFKNWFDSALVPSLRDFRLRLRILKTLNHNNAPAHLAEDINFWWQNKVLVLFPNTTSCIQPNICSCERYYTRKILDASLVAEMVPNGEEDAKVARSLGNFIPTYELGWG